MSATEKPLVFRERGVDYLKLCTDITVYWRGSVFDRVDGVLHFYDRALAAIGSSLKFFETGTSSGAKPLKKDTLDMPSVWLKSSKRRQDIYILALESGAHRNEPSDQAFYMQADEEGDPPVGVLRFILPSQTADNDPAKLLALTQDLISNLEFESGHVGYGVNWDMTGDMALEARGKMYEISRRYLGVDVCDVNVTLVAMELAKSPSIKCVNWLTLLGNSLLDSADLRGKLEELNGDSQVHWGPTGAVIQAGPQPLLGDRNRNVDLSAYRRVGRLLAAHRVPDHQNFLAGPVTGATDPTQEWLARFDR